jgi:hypothetical protein
MDMASTALPEPATQEAIGQSNAPPAPPAALSDRLPAPWLLPLLAFASAWALLLAARLAANVIYKTSWPWSRYFLFKDGGIYNAIAIHGYGAPHGLAPPFARAAFFPVLPLLTKTVSDMTSGSYLPAEVIVQVAAGALSTIAMWALACQIQGRRVADRTVVLYAAFPGAMTFSMLYPEPLANALAALSLLSALNRKWLLAGLLALVAAAEHPALIVLTAVLAVTAARAIWTRQEWQSLIAPLLAPLGVAWYFVLLAGDYHDFFFWFHDQAGGWRGEARWIGHEVRVLTWSDPGTARQAVFHVLIIAMAAFLVAGLAAMRRARIPLPVSLYTLLAVAAIGLASGPGPTPRFAWSSFGVFIGLSAILPRWLFWPLVVVSAGLLAFLFGWWPHQGSGFAP